MNDKLTAMSIVSFADHVIREQAGVKIDILTIEKTMLSWFHVGLVT